MGQPERQRNIRVFVLAFVFTVFVCVSLYVCVCVSGVTSTGSCIRKRNAEEMEGDRQGRQSGLREEIWFFISTTLHPTAGVQKIDQDPLFSRTF